MSNQALPEKNASNQQSGNVREEMVNKIRSEKTTPSTGYVSLFLEGDKKMELKGVEERKGIDEKKDTNGRDKEIKGREPSPPKAIVAPDFRGEPIVKRGIPQVYPSTSNIIKKINDSLPETETEKERVRPSAIKTYSGTKPRKIVGVSETVPNKPSNRPKSEDYEGRKDDNDQNRKKQKNEEEEHKNKEEKEDSNELVPFVFADDDGEDVTLYLPRSRVKEMQAPAEKITNKRNREEKDEQERDGGEREEERDESSERLMKKSANQEKTKNPSKSKANKKRMSPQTQEDLQQANKLINHLKTLESEELSKLTVRRVKTSIRPTIVSSGAITIHLFLDYSVLTSKESVSTFELEGLEEKYTFKALVSKSKHLGKNNKLRISIQDRYPDSEIKPSLTTFSVIEAVNLSTREELKEDANNLKEDEASSGSKRAEAQTKQEIELAKNIFKSIEDVKFGDQLQYLTLKLVDCEIKNSIINSRQSTLHIFLDYSEKTFANSVCTFQLEGLVETYVFKAAVGVRKKRPGSCMRVGIQDRYADSVTKPKWTTFDITETERNDTEVIFDREEDSDIDEDQIEKDEVGRDGMERDNIRRDNNQHKRKGKRALKQVVPFSPNDFNTVKKRSDPQEDDDLYDAEEQRSDESSNKAKYFLSAGGIAVLDLSSKKPRHEIIRSNSGNLPVIDTLPIVQTPQTNQIPQANEILRADEFPIEIPKDKEGKPILSIERTIALRQATRELKAKHEPLAIAALKAKLEPTIKAEITAHYEKLGKEAQAKLEKQIREQDEIQRKQMDEFQENQNKMLQKLQSFDADLVNHEKESREEINQRLQQEEKQLRLELHQRIAQEEADIRRVKAEEEAEQKKLAEKAKAEKEKEELEGQAEIELIFSML